MSDAITLMVTNLGTSVEAILLILTFGIYLIISAKDLRIGLIFLLYGTALEYIILDRFSLDLTYHTITLFLAVVLLALSLLISYSRKQQGGYV
jgi:hypothetical protein